MDHLSGTFPSIKLDTDTTARDVARSARSTKMKDRNSEYTLRITARASLFHVRALVFTTVRPDVLSRIFQAFLVGSFAIFWGDYPFDVVRHTQRRVCTTGPV